jgi:hypothetical protein
MLDFRQDIAWLYKTAPDIFPGLVVVSLENWLPTQHNNKQLMRQYQKTLKTYQMPLISRLPREHTLLAIIHIHTQRLVSFLHCCVVPWHPTGITTTSKPPDSCYIVYSETPRPQDRGMGYNTVLRLVATHGCLNLSIPYLVSHPYPGAKSEIVSNRLQFKTDHQTRYLPVTQISKTYLTDHLTMVLNPVN